MDVAGVIIIGVAVIIICAGLKYADRIANYDKKVNGSARAKSEAKRRNG